MFDLNWQFCDLFVTFLGLIVKLFVTLFFWKKTTNQEVKDEPQHVFDFRLFAWKKNNTFLLS